MDMAERVESFLNITEEVLKPGCSIKTDVATVSDLLLMLVAARSLVRDLNAHLSGN